MAIKDIDLNGIEALLGILREKGVTRFEGYELVIELPKPEREWPAAPADEPEHNTDVTDYGVMRSPDLWGGKAPGFRK